MRNPINATAVLFDGAADGQWTLPDELTDARDHVLRVGKMLAGIEAPRHPLDVRSEMADQVASGGDIAMSTLVDAEADMRVHTERHAILTEAQQLTEARFVTALRDNARTVITEHLTPAFDKLVKQLVKDFKLTGHIDGDTPPTVVLSQDKPVRDALIRIDGNVARYTVLREAHTIVYRLCDVETRDHNGAFGEIRNTEVVWEEINRTGYAPTSPPWPRSTTRDFLQWVANHDAELWLPTPEQQDARWVQVFGPRIEQAAAYASNMRGLAGTVHSR